MNTTSLCTLISCDPYEMQGVHASRREWSLQKQKQAYTKVLKDVGMEGKSQKCRTEDTPLQQGRGWQHP